MLLYHLHIVRKLCWCGIQCAFPSSHSSLFSSQINNRNSEVSINLDTVGNTLRIPGATTTWFEALFPRSALQCHQPVSSAQSLGLTHTWAVYARARELGGVAAEENYWKEAVSGCEWKLLGGVCVCRDWRTMWRFQTEETAILQSSKIAGLSFNNSHSLQYSLVDQTACDNRVKKTFRIYWLSRTLASDHPKPTYIIR